MDLSCLLVLFFCFLIIQLQLTVIGLDGPQVLTFMAVFGTGTLEAEWLRVHAHAKSMARVKEDQKSSSVC